eukprot:6197963-Pleurochrysis_carterae.AAC.2
MRQARASTSKCNRIYVLTPEGRRKYQASYEHVKSMDVQIGGKRVANFAHLSDLDDHACVKMEQALPKGQVFHVSDALEVLEKALYRSDPVSGEIAKIIAITDISASEEEDAGKKGRTPGTLFLCMRRGVARRNRA